MLSLYHSFPGEYGVHPLLFTNLFPCIVCMFYILYLNVLYITHLVVHDAGNLRGMRNTFLRISENVLVHYFATNNIIVSHNIPFFLIPSCFWWHTASATHCIVSILTAPPMRWDSDQRMQIVVGSHHLIIIYRSGDWILLHWGGQLEMWEPGWWEQLEMWVCPPPPKKQTNKQTNKQINKQTSK